MKKTIGFTVMIALGVFFSSGINSFAAGMHMWKGSGGWGHGSKFNTMYDPKTVETITGEVTRIDEISPMKGMSHGIHLLVKTDKEEISVHLGPAWFIENQDVKIEAKDKVEVKGSRISFSGKPAIIAAEIKKGDEMLNLRDEYGYPVWGGWRRHQ
jgi:hypothetical protein